jgi:hypothetical protein
VQRIETIVTGGCQCGAVRYRATAMLDNAHLCHCRMCQKAMGNVFAALVAAPDDALSFTRGKPSVFMSSEHVERGFCEKCGTPLFYRDVTNDRTNLTIGSLDDPSAFPPREEMGTESRVGWLPPLPGLADGGITEREGQEEWAAGIRASNRQHPDHDTDDWPAG